MSIKAIEIESVDAAWKMRTHEWLDMSTLKPKFSVQVYHPTKRKWAHVYKAGADFIEMFKTEKSAERFIARLRKVV